MSEGVEQRPPLDRALFGTRPVEEHVAWFGAFRLTHSTRKKQTATKDVHSPYSGRKAPRHRNSGAAQSTGSRAIAGGER